MSNAALVTNSSKKKITELLGGSVSFRKFSTILLPELIDYETPITIVPLYDREGYKVISPEGLEEIICFEEESSMKWEVSKNKRKFFRIFSDSLDLLQEETDYYKGTVKLIIDYQISTISWIISTSKTYVVLSYKLTLFNREKQNEEIARFLFQKRNCFSILELFREFKTEWFPEIGKPAKLTCALYQSATNQELSQLTYEQNEGVTSYSITATQQRHYCLYKNGDWVYSTPKMVINYFGKDSTFEFILKSVSECTLAALNLVEVKQTVQNKIAEDLLPAFE